MATITERRAREILKASCGRRVLVVGDLMLDRYVYGSVGRISPEAPVPVVWVSHEKDAPGGAANVALNIQSLGGRATVAGVIGRDDAGRRLRRILQSKGIGVEGVVASASVRTTVKTRVVAERQQVVRVDYEDTSDHVALAHSELLRRIARCGRETEGLLIEDYGKGVVCQDTVDSVRLAARRRHLPVGYDPKENHALRVSGITIATPNYKEACGAAGIHEPMARVRPPLKDPVLTRVGAVLRRKWNPDLLVITLGPDGMCLLPRRGKRTFIPTRAREVFDVSGAGDTVIATAMLCLLGGATHEEAASMANYAAGVVVGKLGTATCSPAELLAGLRANASQAAGR